MTDPKPWVVVSGRVAREFFPSECVRRKSIREEDRFEMMEDAQHRAREIEPTVTKRHHIDRAMGLSSPPRLLAEEKTECWVEYRPRK